MSKNHEQSQIDQLETLVKSKGKEFYSLRDKLERQKTKQAIPHLRNTYEGKYFKYRNSMSSDKSWWLYSTCIKVIDERQGVFNTFETTPYQNQFKVASKEFYSLCGNQITKKEYERALKSFILKFKNL